MVRWITVRLLPFVLLAVGIRLFFFPKKAVGCAEATSFISEQGGQPASVPRWPTGRCRLHGGLNTKPKTLDGVERIRRTVASTANTPSRPKQNARHIAIFCGFAGPCWRAYDKRGATATPFNRSTEGLRF